MAAKIIVRDRLRRATAEIHERLHRHAGLASASSGSIAAEDYAQLLARLYGFHRAYESVLAQTARLDAIEPDFRPLARSEPLVLDLLGLGVDAAAIARLPICAAITRPSNAAELLGCRYVVEGSTLGGQLIGRALEPRFGDDRRFFLAQPGNAWRALTDRLETLADDSLAMEAAASAAGAMFVDFERWMDGWRDPAWFAGAAPSVELALSARSRVFSSQEGAGSRGENTIPQAI